MNKRSVRALVEWFSAHARELPWRAAPGRPRDPYAVLVSEAMLQQTQVSRIVERFPKFMSRFPTVESLAGADERDVLALWSGLGYYRRARSLHGAAKMVVDRFNGEMPRTVEELLQLPGVGRYTAGAIASLAYGVAAPIVDGNVARVMLRVHGREARADDREVQPWLWQQAGELARTSADERDMGAAIANEAIMELGATVCLPSPATPRCSACPFAPRCVARTDGSYDRIPLPKLAAKRSTVYCAAAVVHDRDGRVLLEQRGLDGMWAGMWQVPTLAPTDRPPTRGAPAAALGLRATTLKARGSFTHTTTHRDVAFTVYAALSSDACAAGRRWTQRSRLHELGISSAQMRTIELGSNSIITVPAAAARRARPARRAAGSAPGP